MNPWPFVIAAYALCLGGTAVLSLWAWRAARRGEARVEAMKERD